MLVHELCRCFEVDGFHTEPVVEHEQAVTFEGFLEVFAYCQLEEKIPGLSAPLLHLEDPHLMRCFTASFDCEPASRGVVVEDLDELELGTEQAPGGWLSRVAQERVPPSLMGVYDSNAEPSILPL